MIGLKPVIAVSVYVIVRLLTERQLPAACVGHFYPVVFSQYSPEGEVPNNVLHGEAPTGGPPLTLTFFNRYLSIDYPTHPYTSTREFPIL